MKKLLVVSVISLAAVLFSGCKSNLHTGENYVRGEDAGFYVLGFLTVMPPSYTDAISNLYSNAGVKDEGKFTLTNYYVENSTLYFILFSIPKITIEAEKIYVPKNECKLFKSQVVGVDKGFKFLGFMDFDPVSYDDALSDLYAKANVPSDRKVGLIDPNMESYVQYYLLFSLTRLSIRGDLVELPANATIKPAQVGPVAPLKPATPAPAASPAAPAPAAAVK